MSGLSAEQLAFREELLSLYPELLGVAAYLCRDRLAAMDLAHDGIVQALHSEKSFQPGTNLKAWVFVIMKRIMIGQRLKKSGHSVSLEDAASEMPAVEHMGELKDQTRRAIDAIASLKPKFQEVIVPVILGDSYEDISARNRIGLGTVKSRVWRARDQIVAMIESGTSLAFQNAAE